jgi:peptidase C10-like protein
MKKIILLIFIFAIVSQVVNAQVATKDEASQIADNWVQMVIDKYGSWGKSETAIVNPIQELTENDRRIGYYCTIEPKGYIVISLRKELSAIKAYSYTDNLKTENKNSFLDLFNFLVMKVINQIEGKLGPVESVNLSDFAGETASKNQQSWDYIMNYIPGTIQKEKIATENYVQGDSLISSAWHQFPPYNNDCPDSACTNTANGRVLVGCTATAAAQIMRYWSWPPIGVGSPYNDPYNWINMPERVFTNSPAAQQAAVAELSREAGIACDMNYGCDVSGAHIYNFLGTIDGNFRYSTSVDYIYKSDYSNGDWWNEIKNQIDQNQPVEYYIWNGISGTNSWAHALICDGYDYWVPMDSMYHMNMGWTDINANMWYQYDNIFAGIDPDLDAMLINIVPNAALGDVLAGTYPVLPLFYRYFNEDAAGSNAVFNPGQFLQSLPGITITGNGAGTYVRFVGDETTPLNMFSGNNPTEGVEIREGAIRLSNGGSIKLP